VVETSVQVLRERGVDLKRLEEIAGLFARALNLGDTVLLYGPLGAGKTTFVRAVARCLAVTDSVRSPSYTIANIYSGPMPVQHLDLYRLDDIGDEDALALEDYAREDAVTFVEWPEAGLGRLPEAAWTVRLQHECLETRVMRVDAVGEAAADRWRQAARERSRPSREGAT
jgi:tRNA threonylcarbamoyladenosine biosynthesis protein TsaE